MRLLFDARVLTHKTYTGVENYARSILEELEKKLFLVVVKPKSTNKYLSHLWSHFKLPFMKADIIFCPANTAPLFVPKSKRLVVTIHDVAFLTQPQSFSKFFRYYYRFLVPKNIQRADKILTVSKYSKGEIESYYKDAKGKIEVVSLGVDDSFSVLTGKKKEQILYVGSMNERKNFIGVIKAFLSLERDDVKLVMVGNFSGNFTLDEHTQKVLQEAQKHPLIEFRSNVSNNELIQLYNEAKLFVFPSFYEGFGLPVLEAMACGTPVVTSNISSLPEVGGDAVLYCDPYSVEDIRQKIEEVLSDATLQEQMREKGLLRAKEFSWEKSAQEHIRVFEEVLKV
jgi:glycosyltransferase involved in cell wall biosynthesis